jgi:hypothetical protein
MADIQTREVGVTLTPYNLCSEIVGGNSSSNFFKVVILYGRMMAR